MPKYVYKVSDRDGKLQSGEIEANSLAEAAALLRKDNFFVLSIKQKLGPGFLSLLKKDTTGLSTIERLTFTDNLGAMIKSGTPIVEALETYQEDDAQKISLITGELIKDVRAGKKLSESLEKYPKTFSPFYIALVQAGELTGSLDETLEYLGDELRKENEFRERIKSALMYPILILCVAFGVISMLVLLVIPKMVQFTQSLGGDMPLITRIVSKVAVFLSDFGPLLILLFITLVIVFIGMLRKKKTREKLDPYLLKLPLFGLITRKYIIARFLRIVGSCLKYGVPLTASFSTVANVVGNSQYRKSCKRIEDRITKGVSLSEAMTQEGYFLFPKVIVKTVKGAEKTGSVDTAMIRLSDFYEAEVDRNLKRMTDLIEPIMIVFLGLIVGAIAISVVAPIYQMTSKIK